MNARAPAPDSFTDRLSDFLDGELAPAERAEVERHLAGCESCRAVLADLRALVAAAGALPDREPAEDRWPAIAAALGRARPPLRPWHLVPAFAAGLVAMLGFLRFSGRESPPEPVGGARFLLLLREPSDFDRDLDDTQQREIVQRYSRWASGLGARCVAGDELEPQGSLLRPGLEPEPLLADARIGGYFLLATQDESEALALARTCPHLERGGWLEVRRIRRH